MENLPLPKSKVFPIKNNGIDGVSQTCDKESGKSQNHDRMIGFTSIKSAIKRGVQKR